jgi:MoxR-like ATPase
MANTKGIGNLKRVNHKQLTSLIIRYFKIKRSLMAWGTIGIGKSQNFEETARAIAKTKGKEFVKDAIENGKFCLMDVRLSQIDATDIKGIPFRSKDGNSAIWLLPDWLPRDDKSEGMLFLDEPNLAPPSIQAAAYSLILDRKIGSYRLPDTWSVVSAGNRIEDRSNVFEMAAALENRYGHVELLPPTADEWKEWAIEHGIDKRIIAFILWNPTALMRFKPEEQTRNELKEKAFATPRTWEFTSDLIKDENDIDEIETCSSTTVGVGTAMEFVAFLQLRQKIDFKEIIQNPERIKEIEEDRDDLLFTFVTVVADWYKENSEKKHLQRICQVAEHMRGEFAILMLRFCKREHPQSFKTVIKTVPEWTNTLSQKYGDYIL